MSWSAGVAETPAGSPERVGEIDDLLGRAFELSSRPMLLVDERHETVRANPALGRLFPAEPATNGARGTGLPVLSWAAGGPPAIGSVPGGHRDHEAILQSRSGERVRVVVGVDEVTAPGGPRMLLLHVRDVVVEHRPAEPRPTGDSPFRLIIENLPAAAVVAFDHDLRLLLAVGEALSANGYGEADPTGKLLRDVLPPGVHELHQGPYRDALQGQSSDFEYTSPVDGGQFRVRVRAMAGADGTIGGGLATSEDVSVDRARETRLRQIRGLTPFGSCQFDLRSGWNFDVELLGLWGVDAAGDPLAVINELVVPEDRAVVTASWAHVLANGGRSTQHYRIHHGRTDELRHVKSVCEAVVDADGRLVRAMTTHVDVSDAIAALEVAEYVEAEAAQERTVLRQVNDAVATTNSGLGELTARSDARSSPDRDPTAPFRLMTQDQRTVEFGVLAHRDEERRLAGDPNTTPRSSSPLYGLGAAEVAAAFQQPLDGPIDGEARHFIVAPVRDEGAVLGLLSIFRTPDTPHQPGDEQPVQILADRVGASLAEGRLRDVRDQERVHQRAVADRLLELTHEQRELLEQLASTETRERALLADAVHDDPMQMIVAAILRIDNLRLQIDGAHGDELDRIATLLETSVERLRKLIVAITPTDLSDGLAVALQNLAEGIFIGTPSVVTVIGPTQVNLSSTAKATAYRIMREALVNARKHACADNVTLRLEEHDGTVVLSLTDDGVGAESLKAEPGHFGVATMRARANAEDARLHLDSTPGLGTTVVLTLPGHQAERG